jgi:hypothetical protein
VSITLHIHPDQFKVYLGQAASDHPAYTTIDLDKAGSVSLFLNSPAKCDELIAAATEAKRLLTDALIRDRRCNAQPGHGDLLVCDREAGHAGPHFSPTRYLLWTETDGQVTTWTPAEEQGYDTPQPDAAADLDHAIAADLDEQIRRDGDALGRRIAADEGIEPKADPVPWPTGLCGHQVPPGAWAAGFTVCRDHIATHDPNALAAFDEAAAPDLTVVDDEDGPQ